MWTSDWRRPHARHVRISIRAMLSMLRAMRERPRTRDELLRLGSVSRATFWRLLADMQRELNVIVVFDEDAATYSVSSWGIINWRKL